MGLDIHVMPLTRYLSGQFQSPLEQMLGDKVQRMGAGKPNEEASIVRGFIDKLRSRAGQGADWDETGEPAYCAQYHYGAYTDLRAFAAYQDYPTTKGFLTKTQVPFKIEDEVRKYTGLMQVLGKNKPSTFEHLIRHGDTHGYWLPVRFVAPIMVDQENYVVAGSSVILLEELDRLKPLLGMTKDWAELEKGEGAAAEGDPLGQVKYGWSVLHAAARLSVKHRMPIIFDG
jgi:hypothetical protein